MGMTVTCLESENLYSDDWEELRDFTSTQDGEGSTDCLIGKKDIITVHRTKDSTTVSITAFLRRKRLIKLRPWCHYWAIPAGPRAEPRKDME